MGFFSNVFGFPERSYQETQSSLLDIATFTPVPTPYYYRERCEFDVGATMGTSTKSGVNKKKNNSNTNTNTNTNNIITAGIFSTPSVEELRQMAAYVYTTNAATIQEYYQSQNPTTTTTVRNSIGESRELHTTVTATPTSTAAVFQAASQFNYLEMPHPERTPEAGIAAYEDDPTQGPACAVACGAGTAYRNYLVPVELFSGRSSSASTASTTASTSATSRRGQRAQCQLNGLDEIGRYVQEQQCS
jgi:hypothetical protein